MTLELVGPRRRWPLKLGVIVVDWVEPEAAVEAVALA